MAARPSPGRPEDARRRGNRHRARSPHRPSHPGTGHPDRYRLPRSSRTAAHTRYAPLFQRAAPAVGPARPPGPCRIVPLSKGLHP
ncbi:Exonuclease SbcC [Streptomyces murinus]